MCIAVTGSSCHVTCGATGTTVQLVRATHSLQQPTISAEFFLSKSVDINVSCCKIVKKSKVLPKPHQPICQQRSMSLSPQLGTSPCCKTTNTGLVNRSVPVHAFAFANSSFYCLVTKHMGVNNLPKVGEDSMVAESQTHIHGVANPMA